MGFLKRTPLSVPGNFLKVELHGALLANKEEFCQFCGKMTKVCFVPRGVPWEGMHELGALLGYPGASGAIARKWSHGQKQGEGAAAHGTNLLCLHPFLLIVFFGFGGKKRVCPRLGKKLTGKHSECLGLDGFMGPFWSVGSRKGCLCLL